MSSPAARLVQTENNQESQRLFIALWPEEELRKQIVNPEGLEKITDLCQRTAIDNIHMTLFFLGPVVRPSRACIERAMGDMRSKSFTLILDRLGYWSGPQILWLAPSHTPHQLISLREGIKPHLVRCDVMIDKRPYRPHITLARKVKKPPPKIKIDPLSWHVNQYSLMESLPRPSGGVNYQELAHWKLD